MLILLQQFPDALGLPNTSIRSGKDAPAKISVRVFCRCWSIVLVIFKFHVVYMLQNSLGPILRLVTGPRQEGPRSPFVLFWSLS